MSGTNAGIKRNRLPAGVKPVRPDVRLAPSTYEAFNDAARASGNLSLSLYLEYLAQALEKERGGLPVLPPTLDGTEVATTTAA
ncbi:hypothetical protein [uncultured Leifsonia sp.]|uniref:hypothetical protein n=1 Tax=uncultured Leifsonia sp. TaxID=340359 RepID=UPI0025F2D15A|nr:hypothetical protein [uncultured Leifsonia sp.]